MGATINIDPISFNKLDKRFKTLEKHYPEETFKAIVKILFDMKLLAQKNIKANGHIVTSRLRNSIFVKTKKQKFAKRATNSLGYSFDGGSSNRDLSVNLGKFEGAFGTNVEYALKIERLDSFIEDSARKVNVRKRFAQIPNNVNKKMR